VLPIFVGKALRGEPLTIAGDGLQTRRFVYVEDLAGGVVAAVERGAANRVYNLAGDETVTIRELAQIVSELIGNVEIVHTPGRKGDFGGVTISSQRAAEELAWRASTPLREGVRRYVAWLEPERASLDTAPEQPSDQARRPSPLPAWPDAPPEPSLPNAGVMAFACGVGTVIPSMLAYRTDDFGTGQAGYVAVTCLIAILAALCVLPLGRGGRPTKGGVFAGWLVAAYASLEVLPWTRYVLHLGVPHRGTLALCLMGLAMALALATAAMRMRGNEEAATETVS
jgi:hypothetical protein